MYHSQNDIIEHLKHKYNHIANLPSATPGCEKIVILLLCHSALPKCVHGSSDQPMLGCSEHCRLRELIERVCPTQYSRLLEMDNMLIAPSCSENSSQCMDIYAESLTGKLIFLSYYKFI